MIQLLMQNTEGLAGSIDQLGKVQGLDVAEQMAGAMTDQWERMEAGVFAIRAAIGTALLPSLLPMVQTLADGAMELVEWTKVFPNITKWLGYAALGFFGLVAAGGVLTILTGACKMLWATVSLGAPLLKVVTFAFGALSKTLAFAKGAMLALNIVIAANPIVLIVGACVAAVAAIGALTYYWDDLKASFGDTAWFDAITLLSAPFRAAFQAIYGGWKWVTSGFTDFTAFDGLFAIGDELKAVFGSLFEWLNSGFNAAMESVKGLVDWIPGFGEEDETPGRRIEAVRQATPRAQVQQGGVARQMATYNNQGRNTHYGGVNIYAQQVNNPQDLAHELEMAAP